MKNKAIFAIAALLLIFALSFAASAADATEDTGLFGSVLSSFGKLDTVYIKFGAFIDAAIYLIIFLGHAQFTLGRRFEANKGGKAIVIGVGLVLAISLAIWEKQAGFNIVSFGPVAAIVLLVLMGYMIWSGLTSLEPTVDKLTSAAVTYILIYFSFQAVVPNVIQWISEKVPVIGAVLALLAVAFIIVIFVKLISFIISLFTGRSERGVAALNEDLNPPHPPAAGGNPPSGPSSGGGTPKPKLSPHDVKAVNYAKAVLSSMLRIRDLFAELDANIKKDVPKGKEKEYLDDVWASVREIRKLALYTKRDARLVAKIKDYKEYHRQVMKGIWTHMDVILGKVRKIDKEIRNKKVDEAKSEIQNMIREIWPAVKDAVTLLTQKP